MDEKGQDFVAKNMAAAIAAGDPLPGPLGDAFTKDAITIAGVAVRRVVSSDWKVFKAIDSPVFRMGNEIAQSPEAPTEVVFTDEENWELAWQFTHTPAQLREVLAKGREALRSVATCEIGDEWPAETVNMVGVAVLEQLSRQWKTALKHKQEAEEKGDITFFRVAATQPQTASAGGLST